MIKLPVRIEQILCKNSALHGAVEQTVSDFEIWLKDNKLPFFPEYTDHGPDHVASVMRGAEGLVREEAWEHVTPEDAAVLLLSIVLHDCAMHLSEDGFLHLVSPGSPWNPHGQYFLKNMDDAPWPRLWTDFLQEASRFDQQKLVSLFGEPKPVRIPPTDWNEWTRYDRLLMGEFLRRHHARLAHEIAMAGVPGPGTRRLQFAHMKDDMRDLAGFTARSHNLDLRACVDRMPKGGKRIWRNVHAPFLMALLRVADYLEIQAPRAAAEVLQIRSLRSPISRQEWRKHEAVVDVRHYEDDPEALWVDAEPKDAKTFLDLKRLFQGIQKELDDSWTVLGEVYGSDKLLRDLGLSIRRIRSTLDDTKAFGETVNFIPVQARFQASGPDLLKLLIGPLYGHHPAYGVRELMQNAVDACRELQDYQKQNSSLKPELPDLRADVVVFLEELEDGTGWLTVEDRGIGMTPEVVINYFLTAGASFRKSDAWRKMHENSDGHSRVHRAGRFGIGVLAAYLIGEEIEVTTRHLLAAPKKGVRFKCHLDDPEIELQWCDREVGTTVRIRITNNEILQQLTNDDMYPAGSWDWYCLTCPSVARGVRVRRPKLSRTGSLMFATDQDTWLTQRQTVPNTHSSLPEEWQRIKHDDYDDIHWQWLGEPIIHNGFSVRGVAPQYNYRESTNDRIWLTSDDNLRLACDIYRPDLSVFDTEGTLPLNLQRTSLSTTNLPFDKTLIHPTCRDILAFLLVRLSTTYNDATLQLSLSMLSHITPRTLPPGIAHPAIKARSGPNWSWVALNSAGVYLNEIGALDPAPRTAWFCPNVYPARPMQPPLSYELNQLAHIGVYHGSMRDDFKYEGTGLSQAAFWHHTAIHGATSNPPTELARLLFGPQILTSTRSRAVIISRKFVESNKTWTQLEPIYKETPSVELGDHWTLRWAGEDPRREVDLSRLSRIVPVYPDTVIALWLPENKPLPKITPSPLCEAWLTYFKQRIIPFEMTERRKQLAHAYSELAPEIERWERLTARGWPWLNWKDAPQIR